MTAAIRLEQVQEKLARVVAAYDRLVKVIEDSENAFIEHVGIKDSASSKKAKGYFEYITEDKLKLTYLDKLRKDLLQDEKTLKAEVEKSQPRVSHAAAKEWNVN